MTRKRDGSLFLGYQQVRVLANPDGVKHPDGDRPLVAGDIFEFHDALNGNIYWCNKNCLPMQSLSVEHVELV